MNGDYRTAVDLVYFVTRDSARSDAHWDREVQFFDTGLGPGSFGTDEFSVGDGSLLRASKILAWGAFGCTGLLVIALVFWLLLARKRSDSEAAARLPELAGLAQRAQRLVDGLRASSWLVGSLLCIGGFGLLLAFQTAGTSIGVHPWTSWKNDLGLAATVVWLAGLAAWFRHHRGIMRLRKAWRQVPIPEV